MKLLAVKADMIGSKIIRWGLREPASHLAVQFSTTNETFHSYATGIHNETKAVFNAKYEIVGTLDLPLSEYKETLALRLFKDSIPAHNSYDYGAMFYFAYRAALFRVFQTPFPRLNSWQQDEGFLCTEAIYLAATVYAQQTGIMILPDDKDYAMVSPWQALQLVKERLTSCKHPFLYYAS